MANYKAVVNGNWSNLATWQDNSTGSFVASTVLPSSGDSVYLNNFTVTLDQSILISGLSNGSTTGIVQGGTLSVLDSYNITISQEVLLGYAFTSLITINSPSKTITLNMSIGNAQGGNSSVRPTVSVTGIGLILNVNGNLTQYWNGTYSQPPLSIGQFITLNLVGSLTNSLNFSNSASQNALTLGGNCTTNITGNIFHRNGLSTIVANSTDVLNFVGNINLTGSGSQPITNCSLYFTGNILSSLGVLVSPGRIYLNNSYPTTYLLPSDIVGQSKTLYSSGVFLGNPVVGNVKKGIVYGGNNELTGTMNVPPPGSVTAGVSVDNTVGTATMSAEEMWNYDMSNSMNEPGTLGYKLKKMQPQILSNVGNIVT